MATTFKSLVSILFLTLIIKGSDNCSLNNINIGTTRSGRQIQGMPEWNVTVINNCSCEQSQIRLACKGFQTTEGVNPSILSMKGDSCLLINGNPLQAFATVSFSYAWDPPFLLLPTNSVLGNCS
ncbi:protein TAPETUM DETERMINANT 1 [Gastrolobium bilobum]|uniref:protein TAPETUM DETERMINANT 1 n=1 Tax=Gastrolobium bilobum TaxID=150636 RepID=UPI002AB1F647|nr:protein TAPETUM DETERMINANT 1 [Gastrolobium bilobum]